ncbi:TolC family protein [Andreprevotia lacus]|nr:TolC family protein [Andreprevotia lacus]
MVSLLLAGALPLLLACPAAAQNLLLRLVNDPLLAENPDLALPPGGMGADGEVAQICPAPNPAAKMDLADAVRHALCSSPKTRAAWISINAQQAQLGVARSAYLPTLNLVGQYSEDLQSSRVEGMDDSTARTRVRQGQLNLSWKLYDFGAREANVAAARFQLQAAIASRDDAIQTVYLNTAIDYFTAASAQASLKAARENEQAASDSHAVALAKFTVGAVSLSDKLQSETAFTQATYDRQRAEAERKAALGLLASDVGLSPSADIQLGDAFNAKPDPLFMQSIDELIKQASEHHPKLLAARARASAALAKRDYIAAQGRPILSVSGRYTLDNQPYALFRDFSLPARNDDRFIGITLTIPLFEGFSRTYQTKGAAADAENAKTVVDDLERDIASSVWKSYQLLQADVLSLDTARSLQDTARQSFEATQERYQAGVGSILELLNAQKALANAQLLQIQANSNWNISRLRLAAALGRLDQSATSP